MTPPDALIFDFDGLICDTEGCLAQAAERVFLQHGVGFPFERWLDVIGTSSPNNFWVPWLEELVGEPIDEREVLDEFDRHNMAATAELVANPGVDQLLDMADDEGIAVGVASSSSSRWVTGLLDQLGLLHRFSHVLTRGDVVHAKPAPDLYLLAAKRFKSNPVQCVALEDSRNGSLAAVAAGMPCIVVPNELTQHQDLSHATRRVASLADVTLTLLRNLRMESEALLGGW